MSEDKTIDFETIRFLREFFDPDKSLLDQPFVFNKDGSIDKSYEISDALERTKSKQAIDPAKIISLPKRKP